MSSTDTQHAVFITHENSDCTSVSFRGGQFLSDALKQDKGWDDVTFYHSDDVVVKQKLESEYIAKTKSIWLFDMIERPPLSTKSANECMLCYPSYHAILEFLNRMLRRYLEDKGISVAFHQGFISYPTINDDDVDGLFRFVIHVNEPTTEERLKYIMNTIANWMHSLK